MFLQTATQIWTTIWEAVTVTLQALLRRHGLTHLRRMMIVCHRVLGHVPLPLMAGTPLMSQGARILLQIGLRNRLAQDALGDQVTKHLYDLGGIAAISRLSVLTLIAAAPPEVQAKSL